MKLTLNYNGSPKGFELTSELDINIEQDAEALGYAAMVLFQSAQHLAKLCETANPVYKQRIARGINKAEFEIEREQNDKWPFTTFIQHDE